MSGIISDTGQQWEHCNECYGWVRIQHLGYQQPNSIHPRGRDLCVKCADALIRSGACTHTDILPASSWQLVEVDTPQSLGC